MAASDILRNNVKEKLARGEVVASMTVRLSRSIEIARIAKTAGFDMLYIDLEHSPLTMDATGQICMACLDIGIMPAVRVPANTPDYISRILDAGALGVIAPHVRSAAEAREVVRAAKLPPLGERSNTGIFPHLQYRSFPAEETCEGDQRRHHGDRAVRIGGLPGMRRRDHRGRRRRHRAGRIERHAGRHGARRPVRPSAACAKSTRP